MQYCIERVLIKCAHILVVVEGEEWGEVFLGSDFSLGIHHRKEEGRSLRAFQALEQHLQRRNQESLE